jgi:GNAT superfamily N-acetyltransferase
MHGHGHGIGRALLAQVVGAAAERGQGRLTRETRPCYREALHLYEATGWRHGPNPRDGRGPDRTYFLTLATV